MQGADAKGLAKPVGSPRAIAEAKRVDAHPSMTRGRLLPDDLGYVAGRDGLWKSRRPLADQIRPRNRLVLAQPLGSDTVQELVPPAGGLRRQVWSATAIRSYTSRKAYTCASSAD